MKCLSCGTQMSVSRENHVYMSLPSVLLLDVEMRRCLDCREEEVVIPNIEELNHAIAAVLVGKPGRLAPDEFRFLRKTLGWSGRDLARRFHVRAEHVSRWENGAKPISALADLLLRMCVVHEQPIQDYRVATLGDVAGKDPAQCWIGAHRGAASRSWEAHAA